MKELENANIKNKEITSEVANNKNMTMIKEIEELVDNYNSYKNLSYTEIIKKYNVLDISNIYKTICNINNNVAYVWSKFTENKDFILKCFKNFVGVPIIEHEDNSIYFNDEGNSIQIAPDDYTKCTIDWICDFESHICDLKKLVNYFCITKDNYCVTSEKVVDISITKCYLESLVLLQKMEHSIVISYSDYDTIADWEETYNECLGGITYEDLERLQYIILDIKKVLLDTLAYLFIYTNKYEIEAK